MAGIGVSAQTLQYLDQDQLSNITHDPEKEIPYVERIKNVEKTAGKPSVRKPIYATIEREEFERRESALNAVDEINRLLHDNVDDAKVYTLFSAAEHSPHWLWSYCRERR